MIELCDPVRMYLFRLSVLTNAANDSAVIWYTLHCTFFAHEFDS